MSELPPSGACSASAFADLLQTTQAALYAFVRQLTGRSEDARDLVQEVYVAAWRAAQRGSPPFDRALEGETTVGAVRRWLFHVAYLGAAAFLRHHHALLWESLEGTDEASVLAPIGQTRAPEPFEDQVIEGAVLHTALAHVPPGDAACLLLAIVQGFTTAEIAQILEIKPEAARKRLSRAMERLRVAYFAQEAAVGTPAPPVPLRKRASR